MAFVPKPPIPTATAPNPARDNQLSSMNRLRGALDAPPPALPEVQGRSLANRVQMGALAALNPGIGGPLLQGALQAEDPAFREQQRFAAETDERDRQIDGAIALGQRASAIRAIDIQQAQGERDQVRLSLEVQDYRDGVASARRAMALAQAEGVAAVQGALNGPLKPMNESLNNLGLMIAKQGASGDDPELAGIGMQASAVSGAIDRVFENVGLFVEAAEAQGIQVTQEMINNMAADSIPDLIERGDSVLESYQDIMSARAEAEAEAASGAGFDLGDVPASRVKDFDAALDKLRMADRAKGAMAELLPAIQKMRGAADESTFKLFIKDLISPGGRLDTKNEAQFKAAVERLFAPVRSELIGARQAIEELRRVRPFLPQSTDDPVRILAAIEQIIDDETGILARLEGSHPGLIANQAPDFDPRRFRRSGPILQDDNGIELSDDLSEVEVGGRRLVNP